MNNNHIIHKSFRLHGKPITDYKELLYIVSEQYPEHLHFLKEWFNKNAELEVQTSGSTGIPKTIKVKKQYLINSARKTINFFNLSPKTKVLLNLSSEFIAGKLMWIRALIGGWNIYVTLPKNENINHILLKHKFDFGAMVPMQAYHNLDLLNQFQTLIIGGGNVSAELQKKLHNLSSRIYATYGMTETLTHIAVKPLNKKASNNFYKSHVFKDAYKTFDNIQINTDIRGCLVIKAPGIVDDLVITNDLVKILDSKHFLWKGRYDNIVNSGGIKLIPEQIEQKLQKYIKNDFYITGIPDPKLGEKLILIIEGSNQKIKIPDFDTILGQYECPKEIFFIDKFIRTESGKIKRKLTTKKLLNH